MKRLEKIALTLVLCALLAPAALAATKTWEITFDKDTKVGETLVKKGNYKVKFDEANNELTILDGKKVIAKSAARFEKGTKTSAMYGKQLKTVKDADGNATLISIQIDGKAAIIGADKTAGTPASTGQKP